MFVVWASWVLLVESMTLSLWLFPSTWSTWCTRCMRAALWLARTGSTWEQRCDWSVLTSDEWGDFSSCNSSRLVKKNNSLKHAVRTRAFLLERHNGIQNWYIYVLIAVETQVTTFRMWIRHHSKSLFSWYFKRSEHTLLFSEESVSELLNLQIRWSARAGRGVRADFALARQYKSAFPTRSVTRISLKADYRHSWRSLLPEVFPRVHTDDTTRTALSPEENITNIWEDSR